MTDSFVQATDPDPVTQAARDVAMTDLYAAFPQRYVTGIPTQDLSVGSGHTGARAGTHLATTTAA